MKLTLSVKKIKKNSQKEKGENENFLSDRGNYEVVKKNNPSVNNVGVRNLDESSTELSVKNTRKTAKALMKSVNKAFVKVMTKKTEKHFCEAMSPRVNSDPQTGHITSSDTTRKLQATRDPNDISRSSKPADDIVGKLDPNKTFSIITSPAFEKKNYEMQMKEYEMQMKEYHFKKAFLRLVGVIRFGKHAPSVARPIEPERPETACDEYEHVEHVENMKNSLNMKSNHRKSHSQLNKKVILRTVTITVIIEDLRVSIIIGAALRYIVSHSMKKVFKNLEKMVVCGLSWLI